MKKPVEAIERMRKFVSNGDWLNGINDGRAILAYLDSLPEWPADLTRERLEELADDRNMSFRSAMPDRSDALRRLAELAPRKEKRKVTIWADNYGCFHVVAETGYVNANSGLRKVGEAEIDA